MKIFEVLQEADERTGADKLAYMANISRSTGAKLSGKDVADMVGKSTYGTLDPEEVLQKNRRSQSDARQNQIAKQQQDQANAEKKNRQDQRKQDAIDDRNKQRQDRQDARDKEREETDKAQKDKTRRRARIQKADDEAQNYKKDAAGRTLRAPRYYGKDDSRSKPRGAIKKGLDRLVRNPVDTVADYYIDKVDSIKDFLNSEYT